MRVSIGVCLSIALLATGCGDDDRPLPGADAGAGSDAGIGPSDAGSGMMDAGGGAVDASGGGSDAGGPVGDSGARYYADGGCLTPAAADAICGFSSDGRICALSVMCGTSSDDSQCKINCTMGAASASCYRPDDVACLESATTCAALTACGWIL